ncbi:beta-lactamase-like protein, partial [Catenaria anguillulae PL171]
MTNANDEHDLWPDANQESSSQHVVQVHSSQHCFQDDGGQGEDEVEERLTHPASSPAAASSKFKGILLEYPDIAIDHFAIAPQTSSISLTIPPTIFILTHAHSDHTQGLVHLPKGTQVHTSAPTARWIKAYLDPLLDHIDFVTHSLNQPFNITFLDAHHCLGAVSVLVQSKSGPTILHTGDFRFSQDMESLWTPPSFLPSLLCSRSLASSIEPPSIDRVYMDTSFLGIRGPRDLDSALEYPDKHTAINAVTLPSRSLFSRSTRYFVRDCQLGHEQLLIGLFNRFGYISELSPAMYAAYATAACTPTTFTGTNDNDGNDHDPIPWVDIGPHQRPFRPGSVQSTSP